MFIVKKTGRARAEVKVTLGGTVVVFQRHYLDNRAMMVAEVEAESPVIEQARAMPHHYGVVRELPDRATVDNVDELLVPLPGSKEKPAHALHASHRSALQNGWGREDLDGTCEGLNPGPAGGRSPITGLTAAEMALSRPPEDWDSKRGEAWPWECLPWRGPGIGWKPPGLPPRLLALTEDVDSEPEMEPPAPDELVTPVGAVEVVRKPGPDGDYGTEDDEVSIQRAEPPAPPEPASEPEPAPAQAEDTMLDGEDADALLAYSDDPEIRAKAIRVLAELEQAAGAPPSVSKANYHLKRKHGLPTVGKATLPALLRAPVIG